MIDVGKMIAKVRNERGLSQQQLANKLNMSKQAISNYECGKREPDYATLEAIADALNAPMAMFISKEDQAAALEAIYATYSISNLPSNVRPISALHHQRVPMIGEVAAGEPIYAPEDVGVYVDAPVKCDAAITIKGDSMVPNYLDGDVVYIKCVPDVQEGTVAVVFMDDEATLKHVYKRPTGLTLISDNPSHPPIMAEFDDYNNVRIFGVPVGFTRMFKPEPLAKVKKGFN